MSDYEVVIIGAGNGGLTAAVTLARAGRRVLLLERHNVPGGCATSFVRGRFEFEVALHQLSGMGTADRPGPLRAILSEMGITERLEFVEMRNLYRVLFPGSYDITLQADRQLVIAELKARFPREAEAVGRFFELLYAFSQQMIQGLFFRDPQISRDKYPLYFTYALRNTQDVLDEFFEDPLLKAILGIYWSYVGVPPSALPFGEYAIMLFAYIEFKPYHIRGGSQALSNALIDEYLLHGGQVRFNCGAGRIVLEGGRVQGVITEDGESIRCENVISNASTLTTYLELIEPGQVPSEALKQYRSATIGPSAVTLYTGLDCDPAALGIRETTNFIATTLNMDEAFARWKTMEPQGVGLLTCYDVDDPGFSPPGTCQVAIVCLQYADPWYAIPPHRYAEAKYRYAQGLLDLAEKAFPGFKDHIEELEVATPLTHLRYLGHPGGAIYGFDQYAKDSALFQDHRSGIGGLYHTGSWVGSGGFQPTLTSGRQAARAVLKSLKAQQGG